MVESLPSLGGFVLGWEVAGGEGAGDAGEVLTWETVAGGGPGLLGVGELGGHG